MANHAFALRWHDRAARVEYDRAGVGPGPCWIYMMSAPDQHIVITGGAGLVGQNLVIALRDNRFNRITVIDKSTANLQVLKRLHPHVTALEADMAQAGTWMDALATADTVISLHAQIGGLREQDFTANNITATQNMLAALADKPGCYLIHVSTSAVNSDAEDWYTRSKAQQEKLVTDSEHAWTVLRPTLMFGWFDRKHLGWLARFMRKVPIFPVPGHGRFLRQPLYARDFCAIIIRCLQDDFKGVCYDVSGKEKIYYRTIIESIREVMHSRTLIIGIPYGLFHALLTVYGLFDRNPPFTTSQLAALIIDELFPDTDWEQYFNVVATPFAEAIHSTLTDPAYSTVELEF